MFLQVCVILFTGGRALPGGGVVAPGGMRGCSRGVHGSSGGGMHGCSQGGHAWLLPGGAMSGCSRGGGCMGYDEIQRYDWVVHILLEYILVSGAFVHSRRECYDVTSWTASPLDRTPILTRTIPWTAPPPDSTSPLTAPRSLDSTTPPIQHHPYPGQQVGGMHPTGMLSCLQHSLQY